MRIGYTLKTRKNSRYIRLAVHRDGGVIVTAPKRASVQSIESFVSAKSEWINNVIKRFKKLPQPIVPKGNKKDFALHKAEALELAVNRLHYWNAFYAFKIGKVTIRNQKSRWGSCSKSGNLSFSYRIALLPPHLADYVIVHELCHIGPIRPL